MFVIKSNNLTGNLYYGVKELYQSMNKARSDKYFNYKVRNANLWNDFFIVLVDGDNVIGVTCIEENKEEKDYYLISDFYIKEELRNKGYGTFLIKGVVEILKEEGAIKLCSFCSPDGASHKVFEKLNFTCNPDIHEFGYTVPSDDESLYYELCINKEYRYEIINEINSRFLASIMNKYAKEYRKDIPNLFIKGNYEWNLNFKAMNNQENEIGYAIFQGCKCIAYLYLYTVDYDDNHYISMNFEVLQEYICKTLLESMLNKTKEFYEGKKDDYTLNEIRAYITDDCVVKSNQSKYRNILKDLGLIRKLDDDNQEYLCLELKDK